MTSRCPLRCPQRYCDLNQGKDLPVEKALSWIDQAARSGVQTVNLSGGETRASSRPVPADRGMP